MTKLLVFLGLVMLCGPVAAELTKDESESHSGDLDEPFDYEFTMLQVIESLHNAGRLNGGFCDPMIATEPREDKQEEEDPVDLFLKTSMGAMAKSRTDRAAKISFHFVPSRG